MRTPLQWPPRDAFDAAGKSRGMAPRGMMQGRPAPRLAMPTLVKRARPIDRQRLIFWIVLAAIVAQLTISPNLLQWAHIPYNTPGGLPLVKFHIATYLAILAVVLQALQHKPVSPGLIARTRASPAFPLAIGLFMLCAIYALVTTGMSGTAVYIESYAAAAFLGFAMELQTPRDLRRIGVVMVAIAVLNAMLCIGETALQWRIVPRYMTDPTGSVVKVPEFIGEFRGIGLYEHPLAGASITMMAVLLCLAIPLRLWVKSVTLAILLISLIAFGGRAALALTYGLSAAVAAISFARGLLRRTITARAMAATLAGVAAVPALLATILFTTPLGDRIAGKLYADDSAEVRVVQWHIFGNLDLHDWLFGMDANRLNDVMLQIGLDPPLNDIENFWLLVFVTMGIVGFLLWITGVAIMVARLWRAGGWYPKLILAAMLIVASTSNSLGRKSNVLFLCVAAVMSAAAFTRSTDDDPSAVGDNDRTTTDRARGLPSMPAAVMRHAAIAAPSDPED
jgi:hypothetical protein